MIRRGPNMPASEVAERAEKIRNACLRLTRLVESTLNAARLDEGEINFSPRPCDLGALLRGVCDAQPEADQGRLSLTVGHLPEWIEADPVLLEQAIQNLVSNALKYSVAPAPVEISAEVFAGTIQIKVADHGRGIPADQIGMLFRRFFRARTAEGIPGTGIGLSFVLQIAELHGGSVDVKSIEGEGSTFSFRIPLRLPRSLGTDAASPLQAEA
jgi:two-component system, OmpR family, sensor histidine kinase SenX3